MMKSISKAGFLSLIFMMIGFFSFAQEKLDKRGKVNLPPGNFLPIKFEFIDYSYKLDDLQNGNNAPEQNFLQEFTQEELNTLKLEDVKSYNYYMKADEFYKSLSNSVKATFSVKELWYVYMYDVELTNKLLNIK